LIKQNNRIQNPVCCQHCLTPNDHYSSSTAPLTSKRFILYIYSTNAGTEYFKHGINCPLFSHQNAVCFIILTYFVPVVFTFYMLKLKKKQFRHRKVNTNRDSHSTMKLKYHPQLTEDTSDVMVRGLQLLITFRISIRLTMYHYFNTSIRLQYSNNVVEDNSKSIKGNNFVCQLWEAFIYTLHMSTITLQPNPLPP